MRFRSFGSTGWQISEIGFGAWQLGGDWGDTDDAMSIKTLHHAFERGINFVDTAQMYGKGRSESVVGEAVKQWRGGRIYVATKVQPTVWPSPDEDAPQMRGRYPRWHLRREVEACLGRLQMERIDLLQLHCWIPAGARELDWLETLNELQLEGKVDRIGVSIRDYRPDDGIDLARLGLVDSMQVVFNLFEQRPGRGLFKASVPEHAGVYCPRTSRLWITQRYLDGRDLREMGGRLSATLAVSRLAICRDASACRGPTLSHGTRNSILR